MDIGQRIKDLRKENRLTQRQVATATGYKQASVGEWETGRKLPSIDALSKLADFFDVSADYLLGRVDLAGKPIEH